MYLGLTANVSATPRPVRNRCIPGSRVPLSLPVSRTLDRLVSFLPIRARYPARTRVKAFCWVYLVVRACYVFFSSFTSPIRCLTAQRDARHIRIIIFSYYTLIRCLHIVSLSFVFFLPPAQPLVPAPLFKYCEWSSFRLPTGQ